jgi:CheY-like chemotaxis protein
MFGGTVGAETLRLFIADDNPADVRLLMAAIRATSHSADLATAVVADGEEALLYIRRQRQYAACPLPDLALLDINMPRVDGFGVLSEIKNDPALRCIVVIMLSGSHNPADVRRAYEGGASAYLTKPESFDGYLEMVSAIAAFWYRSAVLPRVGHVRTH